jgi:hypothetical protein
MPLRLHRVLKENTFGGAPNFPPYKHRLTYQAFAYQDNHVPLPTLLTSEGGSGRQNRFISNFRLL